jgi:hypothetical protein
MRGIDCAHFWTLKTLPWPSISLFSLQHTHPFPESISGKIFPGLAMRAIDSSHRKTPMGLFWLRLQKLKKSLKNPKIALCNF